MGVLYQIPFNLGHLSLALFGYLLRDWRYFQLAISLPPIILVSYFWFLPESPRWLLAVGRTEDAVKVLEKAAHHNRLPTTTIKGDIATYTQKKEANQTTRSASLVDLFRTPNLRNKTIYICFNWIVCGLCFFGVAQFIGQLGGNIFINVAFSAATQIPGTLFSIWSMRVLGRRYTLIGANVMAGMSLEATRPVSTNHTFISLISRCNTSAGSDSTPRSSFDQIDSSLYRDVWTVGVVPNGLHLFRRTIPNGRQEYWNGDVFYVRQVWIHVGSVCGRVGGIRALATSSDIWHFAPDWGCHVLSVARDSRLRAS